MNPHTYGHLYLTKELKPSSGGGGETAFLTNGAGSTGGWTARRRIQIDPFLSPCTKLKSKWIKDLHIKPDTLKRVEKKVGMNLEHMGTGEKFLNRIPMDYALRSRIDKWNLIQLQSFHRVKDTVNRTKRKPIDWEKIFTNPTSNRGLISNICKELKKLDSKQSNKPFKNGVQS